MTENLTENEDFKYFVQEKLMENIRDIKRYPDRWNYRCPICGDSTKGNKSRGWYYLKTNSAYCWNGGCPAGETGLPILKYLSIITGQNISDLKFEFFKSLSKKKTKKPIDTTVKKHKSESSHTSSFQIKDWWLKIDSSLQKYIDYRQIMNAPYAPKNWNFYFDKKEKRLVIPWIINGEMKCYQLRSIYKNQTPKYKFPFKIEKPVFGIDKLDESFPYIFGLEGAFDSVWVKNGVALGGVNPTNKQMEEINNTLCEFVYMFDNQYLDETSLKKSIKLAKKDINAKIFIWPERFDVKDVNEYIIKYKENPFNDKNFLKNHIFNGVKALLQLNNI